MSEHTPGPWKCEDGGGGWYIGSDPEDGGKWSHVATCDSNSLGSRNVSDDEAEANARLIAAAPDLLAACEDALQIVDHRGNIRFMEVTVALKAAIAKAKGEA